MSQLLDILDQRGVSQAELARRVGVSAPAICRYAAGNRVPPLDVAYRIARALGCDVRDIFPPVLSQPKTKAG